MFYADALSDTLRMGDIVEGFVLGAARMSSPSALSDFSLGVRVPKFSVILTPCCSIGEGTIALAPLERIKVGWLKNPYFAGDLTRINSEMRPELSVPPDVWERLGEVERQQRLDSGEGYALREFFVFAPHAALGKYRGKVGNVEVDLEHWTVDFRALHRVDCEAVYPKKMPVTAKRLELAIPTRGQLRDKIADYFYRVPKEDLVA